MIPEIRKPSLSWKPNTAPLSKAPQTKRMFPIPSIEIFQIPMMEK